MKAAVSFFLGLLSAFCLFAMSFNGSPFEDQIYLLLLITAVSAMTGKSKNWKRLCGLFSLPSLPLFALLILGSLEKGEWITNLPLIILPNIAIWFPAWLFSHFIFRSPRDGLKKENKRCTFESK